MELADMVKKIKEHPEIIKAGMILCHNGIVRGTSRDGKPVKEMVVKWNPEKLNKIIEEMKQRPGIVEILADVSQGTLKPGDDVMKVVVAGDVREHVFAVLMETVNMIKNNVETKKEIFI